MVKNYILDTSVIVHDPLCFYNFEDNNVIIPIIAIEELDNIKDVREWWVSRKNCCKGT